MQMKPTHLELTDWSDGKAGSLPALHDLMQIGDKPFLPVGVFSLPPFGALIEQGIPTGPLADSGNTKASLLYEVVYRLDDINVWHVATFWHLPTFVNRQMPNCSWQVPRLT
ncbi:hypothetical protein [Phaeobacter sp. C3_T13_0]|uniref:hypothetical protein n=1 Tax=Phaeobacter cretensis TaxID=3342641 RepID=UPI0039BD812B